MMENHKTVLMSIHSKWAAEIYAGEKKWEFRTKAPPALKDGKPVVILFYETTPVKKITGYAVILFSVSGSVQSVLMTIGHLGFLSGSDGIGSMSMQTLIDYAGKSELTALSLGGVTKLDVPIDLRKGPQNWQWVDSNNLELATCN